MKYAISYSNVHLVAHSDDRCLRDGGNDSSAAGIPSTPRARSTALADGYGRRGRSLLHIATNIPPWGCRDRCARAFALTRRHRNGFAAVLGDERLDDPPAAFFQRMRVSHQGELAVKAGNGRQILVVHELDGPAGVSFDPDTPPVRLDSGRTLGSIPTMAVSV